MQYSNCWEDARLVCRALSRAGAGGRLLSICSGGDNSLALLTVNPDEILSVDLNPAQVALLHLKIACLREWDRETVLGFLGASTCSRRVSLYDSLRMALPLECRLFFDSRRAAVERGVIHSGRFERFLAAVRPALVELIGGVDALWALSAMTSDAERREYYDWVRGRSIGQWGLSRCVWLWSLLRGSMIAMGEKWVEVRFRDALTLGRPNDNPYLMYCLTGKYGTEAVPEYLAERNVPVIQARLGRIRAESCDVFSALERGMWTGINLSNVLDSVARRRIGGRLGELRGRLANGGRMVCWWRRTWLPEEFRRAGLIDGADDGTSEDLWKTCLTRSYMGLCVLRSCET